jgi:hypothetical protein
MTFRDKLSVPHSKVKPSKKECLIFEDETHWLSRNFGNYTTSLLCLSSQKNEYLTMFYITNYLFFYTWYVMFAHDFHEFVAYQSEYAVPRAVQYQDPCLYED